MPFVNSKAVMGACPGMMTAKGMFISIINSNGWADHLNERRF